VTHDFDTAAESLAQLLKDRGNDDARSHLNALRWSLRDAPTVGLDFARAASDRMRQGRHLDDDPVRDAILNARLTEECFEQSRFALESTIRYLHAAGDLLAQLVNAVLPLGLVEGECDLSRALARLQSEAAHSHLRSALQTLPASPQFAYVRDATNRMKHRNLMGASIGARVNDEGGVDVRQRLAAFEHDSRSHDEVAPKDIAAAAASLQRATANVLHELVGLLTAR
jgi:hypothetical protein